MTRSSGWISGGRSRGAAALSPYGPLSPRRAASRPVWSKAPPPSSRAAGLRIPAARPRDPPRVSLTPLPPPRPPSGGRLFPPSRRACAGLPALRFPAAVAMSCRPEPGRLAQEAAALAGAVRGALGPRGGRALLVRPTGQALLTRDGRCLLEALSLEPPTARYRRGGGLCVWGAGRAAVPPNRPRLPAG